MKKWIENEQGALFRDLGSSLIQGRDCNIIRGYWLVERLSHYPLAKYYQSSLILDLCFYLSFPSRPYCFFMIISWYFQMIWHKQNVLYLLIRNFSCCFNFLLLKTVFSLLSIFYVLIWIILIVFIYFPSSLSFSSKCQ